MRIQNNRTYYLAVFESRNHAIHLYQHLQMKRFYRFELVSTPCHIKAGCSYSIKFDNFDDYNTLQREALALNKKIASLYLVESINGKRQISKVLLNN